MISIRFFKNREKVVCCGYQKSNNKYHLLIYTEGQEPDLDDEVNSISELFDNLKQFNLQIPNALMMDLLEDRASNVSKTHYYKEPVFVEIP
jgi:hypothetical protein